METLGFILQILGSLGIFLFGMKVLSEGIQKTAGERMRHIMATMTHNRLAGVGTGFLTTCLLQSSSATTVIVVSFVNVGLLTLVESIGVIMGANLGTTITAWIIASVGKFSLAKIAIPIIGIGFPLVFIGRKRWKSMGEAVVGFGLLFMGLGLLKKSVPDVKEMLKSSDPDAVATAEWIQGFVENLSGFGYGSILIFLLFGIVLTLIVQSSSAAMAITITFALNGWIGFEESCAIVLGENIGTTVTAWLASLGANTAAKRAARAHFMFNVIGTLWMLVVFYLFTKMVVGIGGSLPEWLRTDKHTSDISFNLAIFHTLFNFLNILLLVGFVPLIAKIVTKWVKEDDSNSGRLTYISQNLVDVGELNLPEAQKAVEGMATLTLEMYDGFLEVFSSGESNLEEELEKSKAIEDEIDQMMEDITKYLVKLSSAELSSRNAAEVTAMMRIVAEIEEASDCVYRLVKLTERRNRMPHKFTEETMQTQTKFTDSIGDFIRFTRDTLAGESPAPLDAVREAESFEQRSDEMRGGLNKAALGRMQDGGDIKTEMLQIDINNNLEKIADHCLHVVQNAAGENSA